MKDTENISALGLNSAAKTDSKFFELFLALFALMSPNDRRESRELSEKIAYLSGKMDTLEKMLFGGGV